MANKRKLIGGATRCENLPAAEFIASHVDLLSEILIRVPAKPVLRFKCVSKQWLLLLSESQFMYSHACRNIPNFSNSILYFNCFEHEYDYMGLRKSVSVNGQPTPRPTLDFIRRVGGNSESAPTIVHSCNGLLLCEQPKMNSKVYIVCNPTTQKFTIIPQPEFGYCEPVLGGKSEACLAFDPSKSPDFKVVSLVAGCPDGFLNIDIYSSESRCWKKMCVPIPPDSLGYSKGTVFWNRAIHWMTDRRVHIRLDIDHDAGGTGALMPQPKESSHEFILYFGECHGRLLLVWCEGLIRSLLKMKILEMDSEISGGWVVKHQLNLRLPRKMYTRREDRVSRFYLLCVTQVGANEEDLTLVLSFPSKIVSYNVKSKIWKLLCDLPQCYKRLQVMYNYSQAYQFVESLAPV